MKIHGNSGKNNPMYGRKHSPETIMKMRLIKLGENNPFWKGDKVGYNKLHGYVRRHFPKPELCEDCKQVPPYDLANITGVYNREFINWKYLCRHCHQVRDYQEGKRCIPLKKLCIKCQNHLSYYKNENKYKCSNCGEYQN